MIAPWIGKLWLKATGWRIEGGPPSVKRAVVIAAPHTSNWDLPYALATAMAFGMRLKWLGKHTLFTVPIWGRLMRALGGIPVDRRSPQGSVGAAVSRLRASDELFLMVPPEGTRSKGTGWKTGFYWIAMEAKLPILLGYLDYARKVSSCGTVFHPTGDIERDFEKLREFYRDVQGKFPEKQSSIRIQPGRGDGGR
jgi:1-acyl-sn-glycerol-3-phosphate acyltransferase